MAKDYNFIPKTYEELFRHYVAKDETGYSIVRALIRKILPHVNEEEMETLAQDIFVRCMAKEVIRIYDPKKANFGGVIFFVTRSVCVNYLGRKSRDPMGLLYGGSLVETVEDRDESFQRREYQVDKFLIDEVSPDRKVESAQLVRHLQRWAKALATNPRHVRDAKMPQLLQLLIEQREPDECAKILGISESTVVNWMGVMAAEVKKWT